MNKNNKNKDFLMKYHLLIKGDMNKGGRASAFLFLYLK